MLYSYVKSSCTVRKAMKSSGETEIQHELIHDTTRISSWLSDFRVVSYSIMNYNSCSISVSLFTVI